MSSSTDTIERPTRSRRLRVSLFGLLLFFAIVALSITVAVQWRELKPLRAENKRLNEERGTLMIEDRSRVHAIKIPARFAGEGRDSFRIFVPEGAVYWVFVVVNDIPKDGYPKFKNFPQKYSMLGSGTDLPLHARLDPGEHVLSIRTVSMGPKRSDIQLIVDFLDATANTKPDRWPSVIPESYNNFGNEIRSETTPADDSGRLELQRHRIEATSADGTFHSFMTPDPDYPLDGVMVWIEPDRK
jgi:hypothetical protein